MICLPLPGEKAHGGKTELEPSDPIRFPLWIRQNSQFQLDWRSEDLQITLGKKECDSFSMLSPDSPTLLFVAFDVVGGGAAIAQARDALKSELPRLPPRFRIGLLTAHEDFTVLLDPTPDRELLTKKIESLSLSGKSGLLDTILPIADFSSHLSRKSSVRVAVLLITDSDIGNYRTNYLNPVVNYSDTRDLSRRFPGRVLQEKITRMTSLLSATPVACVIVHIDPGQDPMNKLYQDGLKQLADTMGGTLLMAKTANDIPVVLREGLEWIRSFYVVECQPAAPLKGMIKIKVTQTAPSKGPSNTDHFFFPPLLTLK